MTGVDEAAARLADAVAAGLSTPALARLVSGLGLVSIGYVLGVCWVTRVSNRKAKGADR